MKAHEYQKQYVGCFQRKLCKDRLVNLYTFSSPKSPISGGFCSDFRVCSGFSMGVDPVVNDFTRGFCDCYEVGEWSADQLDALYVTSFAKYVIRNVVYKYFGKPSFASISTVAGFFCQYKRSSTR